MKDFREVLYGFLCGVLLWGLLVAGVVLSGGCASVPFEKWSKADTARQVAGAGLLLADWGQTLDIASRPECFHECNPFLGSHPSRGEVNRYFGAWSVVSPAVAGFLSPEYRAYWQYLVIGVSGACVVNNYHIGLKFNF